jgi:CheY-like chemotaxis protein
VLFDDEACMTAFKGRTRCPVTDQEVTQKTRWSDFRGGEGLVSNFYKVGASIFLCSDCGSLEQLDGEYLELSRTFLNDEFASYPIIEIRMMDEVTGLFSASFRKQLQKYYEANRMNIRGVIWVGADGPMATVLQTLNWIVAPYTNSMCCNNYEDAISTAMEMLLAEDEVGGRPSETPPVINVPRERLEAFVDFAGKVVWNQETPDFETVAGFSDDPYLCVLSNLMAISIADSQRQMHELEAEKNELKRELMGAIEKKAMSESVAKEMRNRLFHLEAKAEEARNSGYAKSYFYKELSRKIRTPLNGIYGMNSLLAETTLTEEQRDCVDISSSCVENLMSLIDDALNFIQLESEDFRSVTSAFNLFALVSDLSQKYMANVNRRNIDFSCSVDPRVTAFYLGDMEKISQVLEVFVENGMQRAGTTELSLSVEIDSDKTDSSVLRFVVSDNGSDVGESVRNEFIESIGDIQWPLDISDRHLGMGLSIVKKLVKHMGGQVGATEKSDYPNEFWFLLELQKGHEAIPSIGGVNGFDGRRVLLAHDSSSDNDYLSKLMRSWGMRTTLVNDKESVFDMMKTGVRQNEPFDLLVMDCHHTDQFGEKLGALIKSEPDFGDTRMMMISRSETRQKSSYVRNMGFDAYLVKPFRQHDLRDCLTTVLSDERSQRIVTKSSIYENRRGKFRILIVEDNPINQTVALGIIKKLGFRAYAVNSGKEALVEMKKHPYDLVFMDVIMPEMNGYRTTELIRGSTGDILNPDVPIIALTATALRGDRDKCLRAGMNDYLPKPIEPKKLSRILDRYLMGGRSTHH